MITEIKRTTKDQAPMTEEILQTRKQNLLPEEVKKLLPPLYAQGKKGSKAIAYIKFFTPDSSWTWWATEGQVEGKDFVFFGLVKGLETELGYFNLNELASVTGHLGLPIERDLWFKPTPLEKIAPEMFRNEEAGR